MTQDTPWGKKALIASRSLNLVSKDKINEILIALADEAIANTDIILAANQKDLDAMDKTNPMYDRLLLNADRIQGIAEDIRKVASLPSPLGRILEEKSLPSGLFLTKTTVPFGVIGIIYEARPNVSFDVFSLCIKSGNVCVLKGGTDAFHSNLAIVSVIKNILKRFDIDENSIHLLPAGREATTDLLNAVDYVDLLIPRGSKGLINYVRNNAKVPVIETGAGVCHTYFDEYGDKEKGRDILFNAKTRRVSVCNALDCFIIHEKRLADLGDICKPLADKDVVIEADTKAYTFLAGKYPPHLLQKANEQSFGTEFQAYRMSIKTVSDIQYALEHVATNSSKHSEAIISEKKEHIQRFEKEVDAACVYSNASTAFTDGSQFGLGAEIGISTQKLHARGPMALAELTSYKWLIKGNGQTRV
ncbi:MAG: glutamate-5-semialdehyde dehydrogenase [Paludibacteraceae bacterium]|nr:glutamate-5-semialdehyde dehydrogenase [Paludibacteraceae bacterium]